MWKISPFPLAFSFCITHSLHPPWLMVHLRLLELPVIMRWQKLWLRNNLFMCPLSFPFAIVPIVGPHSHVWLWGTLRGTHLVWVLVHKTTRLPDCWRLIHIFNSNLHRCSPGLPYSVVWVHSTVVVFTHVPTRGGAPSLSAATYLMVMFARGFQTFSGGVSTHLVSIIWKPPTLLWYWWPTQQSYQESF